MALNSVRRELRLGLLALGGMALLAGMWAGLVRIGWPLAPLQPDLAAAHGPLMVAGFLGVVIGLERAVALGQGWAFGAPALAGLGSLVLVAGLPASSFGAGLLVGSGLLLVAIFGQLSRLRPEWSSALLLLGALTWLVGNALWLAGRPFLVVVPWWAGFLVFTIAGERLELAQVLLPVRSRLVLLLAAGLVLTGLALSVPLFGAGVQLAGLGLLALAGWLLRSDAARRTVHRHGLPRFGSVSLLLSYAWLGVAGLFWVFGQGHVPSPFWYDAMVHSLFLGFGFSMIFGHAPTIIPAVTGIQIPFTRRFYVHLALLHGSLLLRVLGDLTAWPEMRRWGGLLNVLAILLFMLVTGGAARQACRTAAPHAACLGQREQAPTV